MAFFDYDIDPILKVSNAKPPTKEMTALRKDIRDQMEKQNKFWEDRAFDYTCEEDNQVFLTLQYLTPGRNGCYHLVT